MFCDLFLFFCFFILFTVKTCPLYEPPENGALACHNIDDFLSCVVMCNDKFDFVFNPPLMYFCSEGEWNFYSLPDAPYQPQLPWPDCSSKLVFSVRYYKRTITVFSDPLSLQRKRLSAVNLN